MTTLVVKKIARQILVRALAAGGLADSTGYSQTIYAGTNGAGPLISTTPQGGHLWVTTSSDGGPITWNDRTGPINPLGFLISGIALWRSQSLECSGWDDGSAIERLLRKSAAELLRCSFSGAALSHVSLAAEAFRVTVAEAVAAPGLLSELTTSR